jgi:hypothetical protein
MMPVRADEQLARFLRDGQERYVPTVWQVTVDCKRPRVMAAFWAQALGYEVEGPPPPYATWEDWCVAHGETPEDAETGASIRDPEQVRPHESCLH